MYVPHCKYETILGQLKQFKYKIKKTHIIIATALNVLSNMKLYSN